MRVIFVSNFYNHHQSSLSNALHCLTNGEFAFIETAEMSEERIQMGWGADEKPAFVWNYHDAPVKAQKAINEADYVIFGSAPDCLLNHRHRYGKLTFRYSERMFKQEPPKWQMPLRDIKNYWRFGRHQNEYLLCASAFTAADFARVHTFEGKAYKWGYFPETKTYDLDVLLAQKQRKKGISILWAGRLLGWKHPEASVRLAKEMEAAGYSVELNIIGNGEMEAYLHGMITQEHLGDCVHMLGAMKPEQVREHMENADIFLFTSDFNEGWGAVLNESMNSGCAVVASHAIGSVPFLMRDGENGLVYRSGDQNSLNAAVKCLLDSPALREALGRSAYETMIAAWNAEVAAERFLKLAEEIEKHGTCDLFRDGPCSKAQLIGNGWFEK